MIKSTMPVKIIKYRSPYNVGEEYEVYQSPFPGYWRISLSSKRKPGMDIPKNITDHKR